ncbi:branched-chain amino acid ABC transporter permease [Rhodovarius lipocyclicus]|uniref:branched-chain amino acid ABC transporter permease n=1 Tax=Rhodovarius lipocyclicus TaxID=268410 RepID=UPI001356B0F3|nr:branched-chain amino acid ABC transporter permease [Rhodovarius lipocyclicus]
MSGYWAGILVILAINVIAAYSAWLPLAAGQVNLGTAGFMAVGAYAGAVLSGDYAWPLPYAIAAGAAASGALALLVGSAVLRARGLYLALATLAVNEVVRGILLNWDAVGGASGYPVIAHLELPPIALAALGVFLLAAWLGASRFGMTLHAIEQDETMTGLFGVHVPRTQLAAFAIGGALAGLAGALYAHHFSYIEAQYFTVLLSVTIVLSVVLGGVQTVWGPLVGAAFFTLLPELFRGASNWRYVLFAAAVIGIMALRPQGIVTRAALMRLTGRKPA